VFKVYIFHVEYHPVFTWYAQCVTFNSFPSTNIELVYNFTSLFFLYGFPLIMITFCYTRILCEIYRINAEERNGKQVGKALRASHKIAHIMFGWVVSILFCRKWTATFKHGGIAQGQNSDAEDDFNHCCDFFPVLDTVQCHVPLVIWVNCNIQI